MSVLGDSTQTPDPDTRWLTRPIVIAAIPGILVTIQIWIFAAGNTPVALVLIRNAQLFEVLAGSFVLVLQFVLIFGLLNLWFNRRFRQQVVAELKKPANLFSALAAGIVLLFLVPWTLLAYAVAIALISFVFWLLGRRSARVRRFNERMGAARPVDALIGPVVLGVLLLANNLWLPLEKVATSNGESVVGYVVGVTSEWTTLLSEDKQISYYPTATVVGRSVCDVPAVNLWWLVRSGSQGRQASEPC